MKNRKKMRMLLALFAAVLCMAAFPLTAFAGGGGEEPPEKPPTETAVPEPEPEPNPFTPPGTGTVVDHATDADGKEFYTIVTPDENVFYLIIDRQREGDNVYFLNAVTEEDLMALAAPSDNTAGESAIPDDAAATEPEPAAEPDPAEQEAAPEPEAEQGGGPGMIILLVVAVLLAGGAGYYFKIYRPKQEAAASGDEYEEQETDVDAWDDDAAPYPGDEDAPPWDEDEAEAREDYETYTGEGEDE